MSAPTLSRRAFTLGAAGAGFASLAGAGPAASDEPPRQDPMRAAEELSQLEVTEHIPALYTFYDRMHPDAQAIIPRHVVIGWFREEFQARDPQPAIATGVEYKDWTWAVNRKTYRDTAEVTYIQEFADGSVTLDVVRLVEHDATWRWFFGRDRAWVDEQIRRFTQTLNVEHAGEVPYGLAEVELADDMLARLPVTIELDGITAEQSSMAGVSPIIPDWASATDIRHYLDVEEFYPVGYAQVFRVKNGIAPAAAIRQAVEQFETMPPFTLYDWNLEPDVDTPYARFETFGSDAVGMAQNVMWADAAGEHVAIISCMREAGLEVMAEALRAG